MQSYFEEFHLMFQLLIDNINGELQFQSTCQSVLEDVQLSELKTKVLQNQISELKQKLIPVNSKIKSLPKPIDFRRYISARIAIIIICLFEGLFSIPVFQSFGLNTLESAILGVLFAGVLTVFAEMVPKIISLGKTKNQIRLIILILLILTTSLYIYLANARVEFLNSSSEFKNIHYDPWSFVFMSELLLIIAVAVGYFKLPTKEQKEALHEYLDLVVQKNLLENEIVIIDANIQSIREAHSNLKSSSTSILVYGSMLEEQVINSAKSCYALYKKHNLMHRNDRSKPDCFDEPYPFPFTTYFHTIKLLKNENDN